MKSWLDFIVIMGSVSEVLGCTESQNFMKLMAVPNLIETKEGSSSYHQAIEGPWK
jgi:hypothetical protein